jgi:hypothetical protein
MDCPPGGGIISDWGEKKWLCRMRHAEEGGREGECVCVSEGQPDALATGCFRSSPGGGVYTCTDIQRRSGTRKWGLRGGVYQKNSKKTQVEF